MNVLTTCKSRGKKNPETDSIKFKISFKTPRGKKDSTKRHYQKDKFVKIWIKIKSHYVDNIIFVSIINRLLRGQHYFWSSRTSNAERKILNWPKLELK